MAYTIQDFITRASAGGGVSISASGNPVYLMIDGQPFEVGPTARDIGQFFSARQVLESYPLRASIVGGAVIAGDGATSLSIV